MGLRKALRAGLKEPYRALFHFLAAMIWVWLAYVYGNQWNVPMQRTGAVFLFLFGLVLAVLWISQARRNPNTSTPTEGALALVLLVAAFLRRWSDPPNSQLEMYVPNAAMLLGLIWFSKCISRGYSAIKFGWYDIVAGVIVVGAPIAWLYHISNGEIGLMSLFIIVFTFFMVLLPVLLLRCLIAIVVGWARQRSIPFKPATVVQWLAFPLVAGMVYGYGKSVSSLKIHIYSACLLAASDKLPDGVHGKISGFSNTDVPFLQVKDIPVYGLKKAKDTEIFVTGVDRKGITYAYVHAQDGNTPKTGEGQIARRLWSHWWRLEPKNPLSF